MRSRWRPMRSSSPDSSVRSLSQRNTPIAVPESWTTSWGPSKRKTACTGAMNGSLSSFTSVGSTSRPTRVSSFAGTKSALRLPSRAMAETRARGRTGAAGFGGAGGGRDCPVTGFGGGGGTGRAGTAGLTGAGGLGGGADFAGGPAPFGAGAELERRRVERHAVRALLRRCALREPRRSRFGRGGRRSMRLLRDGGKVLALAYRRAAGKTGSDVGLVVRAAAG